MRPVRQQPGVPTPTPTMCPFCQSSKIKTASDKVDSSTYWRCEVCGELWNLARLHTAPTRFGFDSRWK